MRQELAGEQCVLCGTHAAVRVAGTSFCASCGLSQYASGGHGTGATAHPKQRRRTLLSILSTSLMVKVGLGAVAIAAVGAVAATALVDREPPIAQPSGMSVVQSQGNGGPGAASEVLLPGEYASGTATATTTTVPTSDGSVAVETAVAAESALEYAAATRVWVECVASSASEHSGGEFDPDAVCGEQPAAGDYGVGLAAILDDQAGEAGSGVDRPGDSENAPGHDVEGPGDSENAPGHDVDGPGNSEDAPGHNKDSDQTDEPPEDEKDKPPEDEKDKPPEDEKDKPPEDENDKLT